MYQYQHAKGRLFVHQQPWMATNWNGLCMQSLLKLAGVKHGKGVESAKCTYPDGSAMTDNDADGWISNSEDVLEEIATLGVDGEDLTAIFQRKAVSVKPNTTVAVLKGLRTALKRVGALLDLEAGGPTVEEQPPEEAWTEYYDNVSGAKLDPELVKQARALEIDFMHRLQVYEEATWEEMQQDGCKPIPTRWIDVNKRGEAHPEIRSRLVAQETRKRSSGIAEGAEGIASTFAATPPLEGLRLLMSLAMSGQASLAADKQRVLGFYDISRAHFHSPARRRLYIIPPAEDTSCKTGLARLAKSMYGTRDAPQCFDSFAESVMEKLGFSIGLFSPCLYFCSDRNAACVRHGDDFILLADRSTQAWFLKAMNEHMLTKHTGTSGPRKDLGDIQEIRCLNRLIRWVQPAFKGQSDQYIEWESDPRHIEILLAALGLAESSKALSSPGVKMPKGVNETPLTQEDRELYRSCTMRLAYLALDRPELQYPSKELARSMQQPTKWDMEQLKRAARFLIGAGRLVQRFHTQEMPERLHVFVDSDHAGCLKTRKSTSCTMVFFGKHLLRSSSTTQGVIALSSGESEFYAAVKGASIGLGSVCMIRDLGVDLKKPIAECLDATAGIGIASRKGAGRIRHIHTPCLWMQRAVNEGRIELKKVPTEKNPADAGTKHVDRKVIDMMWQACGFVQLQGQSRKALKAALGNKGTA